MGLPVNEPRKRTEPRVAGTSMNSLFIGIIRSMPAFSACAPRIHDTESMNSNWFVCWNFGRKSGDPMRPRPESPKYPSMVMPGSPPATVGLVTNPGIIAACGGVCPKGCCTASDVACDHENRNSFKVVDDTTRVHPPTSALVLIV